MRYRNKKVSLLPFKPVNSNSTFCLQICIKHLHCVKNSSCKARTDGLTDRKCSDRLESCFARLFYARSKVRPCNACKPFLPSVNDFNIISLFVLQRSYKSVQYACCTKHSTSHLERINSYPNFSAHILLFYCFSLQTLVSFAEFETFLRSLLTSRGQT